MKDQNQYNVIRTLTSCILILGFCVLSLNSNSQITRGALPGEIYVSMGWYYDGLNEHRAIFRSEDNGEHLSIQYSAITSPPPGEMKIRNVLGDAMPDIVYNYSNTKLWVSIDKGENWELNDENPTNTNFFSSVEPGLVFKGNTDGFFKSIDFGETFTLMEISVICPFDEVGFAEAEFFGVYKYLSDYYNFVHTIDYGQTYTEIELDSTVAYWSLGGQTPGVSRGSEPGELYLISWTPDYHYKVFHSIDTGYSWTQKYESGYIDIYWWGVTYTAGREPGSFYVTRARINPDGNHVWLYIDHSSDYGETFTTYFHDLDSTYTSVDEPLKSEIELSSYPNPFSNSITIHFQIPPNCSKPELNIYNNQGVLIMQFNIVGQNSQQWDGWDFYGNIVPKGVYFYQLSYDDRVSGVKKIIAR